MNPGFIALICIGGYALMTAIASGVFTSDPIQRFLGWDDDGSYEVATAVWPIGILVLFWRAIASGIKTLIEKDWRKPRLPEARVVKE